VEEETTTGRGSGAALGMRQKYLRSWLSMVRVLTADFVFVLVFIPGSRGGESEEQSGK
jgi:hypothetical protein